jgi:hypothetical protein
MGFRFRKILGLLPGVRLNLGKGGHRFRFELRGLRQTFQNMESAKRSVFMGLDFHIPPIKNIPNHRGGKRTFGLPCYSVS